MRDILIDRKPNALATNPPDHICPNCGTGEMSIFYDVRDIPVHSALLINDQETALRYPKGDLLLAFCSQCGFIGNTAFHSAVHEYSPDYEETQGFSPTFNAFARKLGRRLVDEFELKGKRVLEIGCGKGEFINLLCELGMVGGVGFDPAFVPGRIDVSPSSSIDFVRDYYGPGIAHDRIDLVCCRHTLEHIPQTRDFLCTLRKNIGDNLKTVIFFEVPDALRILREGAFWDFYYEHCSYFTAGSLARVFRSAGFEIIDLRREYDNQYLTLVARPASSSTKPKLSSENDWEETAHAFHSIRLRLPSVLRQWSDIIRNRFRKGARTVLWGSGSKAVAFLTTLGLQKEVSFVVDINPHRHGKFMPGVGQQIVSPAFLKAYNPDCVVVMNPVYTEEIRNTLKGMGLEPEVLALNAEIFSFKDNGKQEIVRTCNGRQ